ncbi:MAG: hypothetical protein FJW63_03490, partial [Actinobacteria bacterium]|nr:hypothetical protein [Actinomycetota bacterium]
MSNLSSKERMIMSLNHQEPNRVPYQVSFVPEMFNLLKNKYLNFIEKNKKSNSKYDDMKELDIFLGHDMLDLCHGISLGYYRNVESDTYTDEWGIKWKKVYYNTINGRGHYTEIIKFPLANDHSIDDYIPPNPENEDFSYTEEIIKTYGREYFISAHIGSSLFEGLKYLRGLTQSLIDVIANKGIASKIINMTVDYHLKIGLKLIEKGIDMLWLADDYGGEDRMLISSDTFRELIKPKMGYMISELKRKNKNIKIAFHSCGYIEPIIDDLIEIGLDILNPIQPEAMDPAVIKKRYGRKLVLWGSISNQRTLPFGTPKDVE